MRDVLLPSVWFPTSSNKNPLKTNKNTPIIFMPTFPSILHRQEVNTSSEYVNMQMRYKVSLQRKRLHMQGFE